VPQKPNSENTTKIFMNLKKCLIAKNLSIEEMKTKQFFWTFEFEILELREFRFDTNQDGFHPLAWAVLARRK
jgi:hypothetical protein